MSIKEIKEAIESKKVYFGLKECIKHKKDLKEVYLVKDAREEIINQLNEDKIKYSFLKTKKEVIKLLNLDFNCEVFSLVK
ncbi:MAG: hypothetical protein WC260_00975 [Candidatus Pacearchaeota archaeon]